MPKQAVRMTALDVANAKKPGAYADGEGLYLHVSPKGAKSWIFRYSAGTKRREMGLGSTDTFSLKEARQRAADARKVVAQGQDPLAAKQVAVVAEKVAAIRAVTFSQCAERYIAAHQAGWRNEKHCAQWTATIATYANPHFGELPVGTIETPHIMKALEAIWTQKPETASRLRGRIEAILDWATVSGLRDGANPARWKGHIQALLPKRSKVAAIEHHAALAYDEMPSFFLRLQAADGMAAKALQFAILTAARTGEVLGATWQEIDFEARQWTVPASRMKAGKEHRVALSQPALALLRKLATIRQGEYVFSGQQHGKPLSNMALLMCLRRLDRDDLTAHGFRSTFRDWCAEKTSFASEVAEMALAHAVPGKVEAAYRRGDMLEKRRQLMEQWGQYCCQVDNTSNAIEAADPPAHDAK
jgi:integrase